MKKIIALIILGVIALTTTGYTQETVIYTEPVYVNDTVSAYTVEPIERDWRTRFYVGVKGGINYSNVYDSEGEDFQADSKFGFAGGVFMSIPIGRFLGIQPEVLFSQRGFHGSGTLLGSTYKLTRTSNYIDIPLLVAIKAGKGLTLMAGPQFSYLLKQTDEFTSSAQNIILQEQEFKNDNITKNMLCFLGGLDFNFDHFVIGTRVGWDIRSNKGDGTSTTPRYKNALLQGTIGIRF